MFLINYPIPNREATNKWETYLMQQVAVIWSEMGQCNRKEVRETASLDTVWKKSFGSTKLKLHKKDTLHTFYSLNVSTLGDMPQPIISFQCSDKSKKDSTEFVVWSLHLKVIKSQFGTYGRKDATKPMRENTWYYKH